LGTGFVGAIASGILAEKTGKMEQIAKAGRVKGTVSGDRFGSC